MTLTSMRSLRRVPAWKIAVASSAAFVLVVGAFRLWVDSAAARRWTVLERQVRELSLEIDSRDRSRPVLRGEPIPGNAWDDYVKAIRSVEAVESAIALLDDWSRIKDGASGAALAPYLDAFGPALLDLRRGVRRAEGLYRPDGMTVPDVRERPPSGPVKALVSLGLLEARRRADSGRSAEAAEILLDLAQFSRDAGHGGTHLSLILGVVVLDDVWGELRDLQLSGRMDPDLAARVARELEILDASFPDAALAHLTEALDIGLYLKGLPDEPRSPHGDFRDLSVADWRHGYSWKLKVASGWAELRRWHIQLTEAERKLWPEARRIAEWAEAEQAAPRSELARRNMAPFFRSRLVQVRACRARLRLLRAAAHHRATGIFLELEDPFGTRIRHASTPERILIWSVGQDGVDHGGVGTWNSSRAGTDLVFEIRP